MTPTTFRQFPLRRAVALALVTVLASCGGFTAVSIGGTVTGLTGTGLSIANAGKTIAIAPGATSFTFPDQVDIRSCESRAEIVHSNVSKFSVKLQECHPSNTSSTVVSSPCR